MRTAVNPTCFQMFAGCGLLSENLSSDSLGDTLERSPVSDGSIYHRHHGEPQNAGSRDCSS